MSGRDVEREVERQLAEVSAVALRGGGEEIGLRDALEAALRERRPLRVKLGMDPSSPDLHLGHTVVLETLRRFQALGHTPIFLVGDFTARIGDPSGRSRTRPALDEAEVERNAATYLDQVGRVLDVSRVEVRKNGEWMDRMAPGDFVRLCAKGTVARLLERDDFARRYRAGVPIAVHELLYPFVQGYDSVALRADVELGGTDQTFNLLMARELQRDYAQTPQAVVTHPLLVGLDGREKMSKSLCNAIGISEPPGEIYGKVMSISDELLCTWVEALSFGRFDDLEAERARVAAGGGDPFGLKHGLAFRVVERFHGRAAAEAAAADFRRVVQRGEVPSDLPEVTLSVGEEGRLGLLAVLRDAGLVRSTSEAHRLVREGAVRVEEQRVRDPKRSLERGTYLVRAGRRRYARVRLV